MKLNDKRIKYIIRQDEVNFDLEKLIYQSGYNINSGNRLIWKNSIVNWMKNYGIIFFIFLIYNKYISEKTIIPTAYNIIVIS